MTFSTTRRSRTESQPWTPLSRPSSCPNSTNTKYSTGILSWRVPSRWSSFRSRYNSLNHKRTGHLPPPLRLRRRRGRLYHQHASHRPHQICPGSIFDENWPLTNSTKHSWTFSARALIQRSVDGHPQPLERTGIRHWTTQGCPLPMPRPSFALLRARTRRAVDPHPSPRGGLGYADGRVWRASLLLPGVACGYFHICKYRFVYCYW